MFLREGWWFLPPPDPDSDPAASTTLPGLRSVLCALPLLVAFPRSVHLVGFIRAVGIQALRSRLLSAEQLYNYMNNYKAALARTREVLQNHWAALNCNFKNYSVL